MINEQDSQTPASRRRLRRSLAVASGERLSTNSLADIGIIPSIKNWQQTKRRARTGASRAGGPKALKQGFSVRIIDCYPHLCWRVPYQPRTHLRYPPQKQGVERTDSK